MQVPALLPGFPCRQGWPITQAMNASSSPRHFIAANNMFDAQYINYYTGLSPVLLVRGSFPLPPPVSTQTLQFMNFSKQSKIPLNGLFFYYFLNQCILISMFFSAFFLRYNMAHTSWFCLYVFLLIPHHVLKMRLTSTSNAFFYADQERFYCTHLFERQAKDPTEVLR